MFQRGLVDTLGRLRGTSQMDRQLQDARGNLQFDEYTWFFGIHPVGPKTPTPSFYRSSITDLRAFNDRLEECQAVFDPRADNLLQFVDGITNDIGATILAAAHIDFQEVIAQRGLTQLWQTAEQQMRTTLDIQPFIVPMARNPGG